MLSTKDRVILIKALQISRPADETNTELMEYWGEIVANIACEFSDHYEQGHEPNRFMADCGVPGSEWAAV